MKIKYRKARLLYEHDLYDQAIPGFAKLALEHDTDELAVYSANLLLDSLNMLGRHAELVTWIDRLMARPKLMEDAELAR